MDKRILISLLAILSVLTLSLVSAADNFNLSISEVNVNGANVVSGSVVSGLFAGDIIPVKVIFASNENDTQEKVTLSLWISGHRTETKAETETFDVIPGSTYSRTLSLNLPTDVDPSEDFKLVLRFESEGKSFEREYPLKVQRESFATEMLSVDMPSQVDAGNVLNIDVVLKNTGRHDLEDMFVTARISSLGIEKRVYFGDIVPQDTHNNNDDEEDSSERVISLKIPSDAKAGTYSVDITAENSDTSANVKKTVTVAGTQDNSEVLVASTSKNIAAGEEASYDLVIVNPGSKMQIYTLSVEDTKGLIVNLPEQIVTVAGDSSRVVKVIAKAASGAEAGTYTFGVNVNAGDTLVKKVNFSANVESKTLSSPITMLTIILVIVFVVLLIVLIVLLTREKAPEPTESYY